MIARLRPDCCECLTPAEKPDELGRLGPYRVLEVLGSGGMGVVYRAEDVQLHRPVALKVLLPSLAACPAARERFLHEARAAAAVEHDHVVPIWQVGKDCGVPFIAMPLLRGESLDQRLDREGRLPLAEVLRIGRQTARGLAAAHARGLVHCDVKPSNLWLEDRGDKRPACLPGQEPASEPLAATGGDVKILDFGLARAVGDDSLRLHQDTVAGTPSYMAPEQSRGGDVDGRTDLFSLGCVLYRMATGELPFKGTDSISTLIVAAVDAPTPPIELNPDLPPALSDLVLGLLAKDPAERPSSAEAAARALEDIERAPAAGRPQRKKPHHPPSRRRWPSLLIAALVLLLVCGPAGSPLEPAQKDSPPSKGPDAEVVAPPRIVPAAHADEEPRGERRADVGSPELVGVLRALQERRDAVGRELLRAQSDLEELDARLRARQDPAVLPAVESDGEVQALRSQIDKARAVLDEYRLRGHDLRRPTPLAAARALVDLQIRLDQRMKKVEQDLRSAADGRDALRQARQQLADRLAALRRIYDSLEADLERFTARKAEEDHAHRQPDRR
jgi:serine/threonine protein kinase